MKKHDTKRKEISRRKNLDYEQKLSQGLRFVVNIGQVEKLRNPELWK